MKLIILILSIFALHADDQQFVNQTNGFVVVEERQGKIIFHDPILEEEMKDSGVVIPPEYQKEYQERERVRLGEEGFFKAFKEFYSVYIYDQTIYHWK